MALNQLLKATEIHRHNEQQGRCLYCYEPMWVKALEPPGIGMLRMRYVRPGKSSHVRSLGSLASTKEHLHRIQDGGQDEPTNIAAACQRCNSSRKQRTPKQMHDETQAQRLALFLEIPPDNVVEFCAAYPVGTYSVQKSIAVTFPTYNGDGSILAREHVYRHRAMHFGTKAEFASLSLFDAVASRFSGAVYRSSLHSK